MSGKNKNQKNVDLASVVNAVVRPKIIQLLLTENNERWQGRLLGLANNGATYYVNKSGEWELFIDKIHETA